MKSEILNSNFETISPFKIRTADIALGWNGFIARFRSVFGLRICSGFRISKSGFLPIGFLLLGLVLGGGESACASANAPASQLLPAATVDSTGVFFHQVIVEAANDPAAVVRLCDAPAFGQTLVLTRAQILATLRTNAPQLVTTNWTGVDRIRISRRVRLLKEAEVKEQLVSTLQKDVVREKGELELRLNRPWAAMAIPDEPYKIHILDLPTAGVTSTFIVRFELLVGEETVGNFQLAASGRIFRDVPVSRGLLKRGQSLHPEDVTFERRDVLALRDAPADVPWGDPDLELVENISPGAPLFVRSVRLRPAVPRGKVVEGRMQEGALSISVRVEALEDGVPGQTIRVRNPQSKREFKGKVQDAQTIMVVL